MTPTCGLSGEHFKLWALTFNKSGCKFGTYFNYALQKKRGQREASCWYKQNKVKDEIF